MYYEAGPANGRLMPNDTGKTESLWMVTAPPGVPPRLSADLRTDVCIIGAGIAGMSTAYLLTRAGKKVVVLEDGAVGGGETGRTTAHLSNALDDRYHHLEKVHGADGARLAAASHGAAIDRIEQIVLQERIDCGFQRLDGYLFAPTGESPEELEQELEAARRAGVAGVEWVPGAPFGWFETGPCLRFPRQGQFHPLTYLQGLQAAIERSGGRVFGGTHVNGVEPGPPARITTELNHTVTADYVVCATNTPVIDWLVIHSKQAAYRTFAIGARLSARVTEALLWDTADPYHYVRLAGDILIVGGEDHKTGQADDGDERLLRLESWTRERFAIQSVEFRWSGQVMEPVDGLGYIGRNPGDKAHVFVATGDSGHGMTHGTIAGMLITDLITGQANPWTELYDPARKSLRAAGDYVKENVNVARQYSDHLTPGEVGSEEDIAPGRAGVVRSGLKKIAVYRDERGALHRRSAVCPHLGCVVHWNSLARSWDCPCHGSRFGVDGHVMNGPAMGGLAEPE